ncbi:CRISPR-associated protein Cas4 [Candidatus Acidulodesulfobacterium sp. H_13]|uniref:CRISPR-associated protein Cas4 n=1 Tax=Candidatus Acidulodesulfobacterium sp. H_13 TaxID=3395470 RepID=UPI003AF6E26E
MKVNGSLIQAYNICPRQAWLMSRQMSSNQNNSFLEIGRLIDQTTFKREKKKIYLAEFAAEIDFITLKNGNLFVAEIKKSSRTMASGIKQLKYYLYLLNKKGIKCKGLIKIPKEKISITVELKENDEALIKDEIDEIVAFLSSNDDAPVPKKIKFCGKCSYFEFCWS